MELSDEAAVLAVRGGNRDAFRVLVERYSRSVFRLGYRMTGNEQDAEDVVQEAFLRAYKQLNRYESRSSFSTWLYRIAANYSLDLIRARRKSDAIEDVTLTEGGAGPERLLHSSQVQETLDAALESLTQQERTAFVLRHYEGLSIEEISGTLGINNNAAKHSVFRAVQKLRKVLAPFRGATDAAI
jgi:RNA polymerase sigma-70 factor (ECF subfamily)